MDNLLDMEARYKDLIAQDISKDSDWSDSDNEGLVIDIKTKPVNDSKIDSSDAITNASKDMKKPKTTSMEGLKKFVNFYKVTKVFEEKIEGLKLKNKHKTCLSMSCLSEVKEALSEPLNEKFCKKNIFRKWKSESNLIDARELNYDLSCSEQLEFICDPVFTMPADENEDLEERDPLSIDDMEPVVEECSPKKGSIRLRKFTELIDDKNVPKAVPKKLNIPVKFDLKKMKVIGQSNLAKDTVSSKFKMSVNNTINTSIEDDEFNPKIEASFSLAGNNATNSWNISPTKATYSQNTILQNNQAEKLQIPPREVLKFKTTPSLQLNGLSKTFDDTVLKNIKPVFSAQQNHTKSDSNAFLKTPLQVSGNQYSSHPKLVTLKPKPMEMSQVQTLNSDSDHNIEIGPTKPRKTIVVDKGRQVKMIGPAVQETVSVSTSIQNTIVNYPPSSMPASVPSSHVNYLLIDTKGGTQLVKQNQFNPVNVGNATSLESTQSHKMILHFPQTKNIHTSNNFVGKNQLMDKTLTKTNNETVIGNIKLVKPSLKGCDEKSERITVKKLSLTEYMKKYNKTPFQTPENLKEKVNLDMHNRQKCLKSGNEQRSKIPQSDLTKTATITSLVQPNPPNLTIMNVKTRSDTTVTLPLQGKISHKPLTQATEIPSAGSPIQNNLRKKSWKVSDSKHERIELVPSNAKSAVPSTATIAKTKLLFRKDIPKRADFVKSIGFKKNLGGLAQHGCTWCKTSFSKKYLLNQHIHRITCNMVYECIHCAGLRILFRNRCQLLMHLLKHYGSHRKIVINYNKLKIYRLSVKDLFKPPPSECIESDDEVETETCPLTLLNKMDNLVKPVTKENFQLSVKANPEIQSVQMKRLSTESSSPGPAPKVTRADPISKPVVIIDQFKVPSKVENVSNSIPGNCATKKPSQHKEHVVQNLVSKFANEDVQNTSNRKSCVAPEKNNIVTNTKVLPKFKKPLNAGGVDGVLAEEPSSSIQAKISNIKEKINETTAIKRPSLEADGHVSKKVKSNETDLNINVNSLMNTNIGSRNEPKQNVLKNPLALDNNKAHNNLDVSISTQDGSLENSKGLQSKSKLHKDNDEIILSKLAKCPVCKLKTKNECFNTRRNPNRMFVCTTYCQAVLSNPCTLKVHTNLHERKRPFICPTCGEEFDMYKQLSKHMTSLCKPRVAVACCLISTCNFVTEFFPNNVTKVISALNSHLEDHSKETETNFHICKICKKSDLSNLTHFSQHNSKGQFILMYTLKCNTCNILLDSTSSTGNCSAH